MQLFPQWSFSIQNVCSLNSSRPSQKTSQKIRAIVKGEHDITFLSDVRLNSCKQKSAVHDIEKKLSFLGYKFYHNSSGSSRGVGILISTKINAVVSVIHSDLDGNILLLKLCIGDINICIGAIYGPNNDDKNFLNIIEEKLSMSGCHFIVIGGDWNTTLDSKTVRQNIDTLNTAGIPSINRSNWLNSLCRVQKLVDPFRTLHPYKKEFTYVPFAQDSTIRSRLDFFLVSDSLATKIVDCRIPNHLSSTLFDHKSVP